MKAAKILLRDGEGVRRKLAELDALEQGYKPSREDSFLLIPIKDDAKVPKGIDVVEREFERHGKKEETLLDVLKGKLTEEELEKAPRAFDTIGDIAVIEVDDEIAGKEKLIAAALMALHGNIKVVVKKAGFHGGEFRTRKVEVIAGENRKATEHRENGVRLRLNVETCYFSPRLSTERRRIAEMVKEGERVLVMFSGVAPYPLVLAKNSKAKEIVGVELNPECHRYAQENVLLNDARNVRLHLGDVKDVVPKLGKFDRIIMPLPKSAEDFLDVALLAARKGTIIHFYDFQHEKDIPKASIDKVLRHWKEAKIIEAVKCGQYSPGKFRVCVDFEV